ncbi:MAG: MFS transporter [Candidatus Lernaella stagnicola]|nr:MFS transporter [Candidatus Lernaella stagnicola]
MPDETRRIFVVLWLSLFTALFGMGILAPLLPTYATEMGASGTMLGLIFAGFSLGRLITMPIVGHLSDKYGRKGFIALGLGVQVVAAVAFLAASSPTHLMIIRIFQGIAGATVIPISMAMVGEISPKGKESTYMGYFTVALFTGFGLGPLVSGFVRDYISMDANFILLGLLCFAAFVALLLFLPAKYHVENPRSQIVVPYRKLAQNRVLRAMFFYRVATSFGRGVVAAFFPLYGEMNAGLTASLVGVVISANILATAALQPFFGRLADRVGRRQLIIAGLILQAIPIFIMPFLNSFWPLLLLNVWMGAAGAVSLPAASGLITQQGKKGGMGGSMAIFNIGMSVGLGSGPVIGGLVSDSVGFTGTFILGGMVVLLGLIPILRMRTADSEPCEGLDCAEEAAF